MTLSGTAYDFSRFSAGTVDPKYHIVEWVITPKRFDRLHAGITFGWIAFWLVIMGVSKVDWLGLFALLPILMSRWLGEQFFRYERIGQVTLKDSCIQIAVDGKERQCFDLKQLRSLGLWSIICDPGLKSGCRLGLAWAVMLSIRHEGVTMDFEVINDMYLTPQDRLQFMRPPPSFGGLIQAACDAYRVRLYNAKGKYYE